MHPARIFFEVGVLALVAALALGAAGVVALLAGPLAGMQARELAMWSLVSGAVGALVYAIGVGIDLATGGRKEAGMKPGSP